jgi:hypothetical protein
MFLFYINEQILMSRVRLQILDLEYKYIILIQKSYKVDVILK